MSTTCIRRLLAAVAASVAIASLVAVPAHAATGNQGYAVYRDGVYWNYEWHAAIMALPHHNSNVLPVIHHPGWTSSEMVEYGKWSEFLRGRTYTGTYRPNPAPSSAHRDSFLAMARRLVDEQIQYDPWYQVNYNVASAGTWVDPDEVTRMRCDGVIEYIYEWYGYKVYGNAAGQWDVTKAGHVHKDLHSGANITPKKQALNYLTRVTASLP